MKISIVNYNGGNAQSVLYAVERIGATATITDCCSEIQSSSHVILPGVGHAKTTFESLRIRNLIDPLKALTVPFLGICVGMQLLFSESEEGPTNGLGIIQGKVKRFTKPKKIPHVGWSPLRRLKGPLFKGVSEESHCYFVHSFMSEPSVETTAYAVHEQPFSAAVVNDNFFGVQFHPEKSGSVGELILKNFLRL